MRQRLQGPIVRLDKRWIVLLGVVVVLAIGLGWWRPWRANAPARPQPVALVPTPTPLAVPVATRAPERSALPAATPTRPAAAGATPGTAVTTPAQTGTRAPGMLLYVGSLEGKRGIIAASADASERRLVAEGRYQTIAWAPDGDRFAAVGMLDDSTFQVAIFAPEGRVLGRYPFPGRVDRLLWSDGGGVLACLVRPFGQPQSGVPGPAQVWLLNGQQEPQRVVVPDGQQAVPLAWTPAGRLHVATYDSTGEAFDLLLVGPDGRTISRSASGPFLPIGFADDGDTAIVARIPTRTATPGATGPSQPTEILALDLPNDGRRTIFGSSSETTTTTFVDGQVAPDGEHLALVVSRGAAPGIPQFGVDEEAALVFVRLDGTVTGVVALAADARRGLASWSPDGALLATYVFNFVSNDYAIQIFDSGGAMRGLYNVNGPGIAAALAPAWSPDGRWFAYAGPGGLTIASMDGYPPYGLDTSGEYPAWRPR